MQYGPNYLKGNKSGGRGEIRTHERLATLPVFKTGALNHSATLPSQSNQGLPKYAPSRKAPNDHKMITNDCGSCYLYLFRHLAIRLSSVPLRRLACPAYVRVKVKRNPDLAVS